MRQNKYEYDAFISHAVEDKIPIANELCAKLERAGLKIWYSGKELGVGDSIEKTIERGLNRSRYGIVIFSPTYLAKNWTIREFYTLLAKEIEEQKVILPVLYNITLDELKNKDLVMADRFAVNSDKGLDHVVERLLREIKKPQVTRRREAWYSRIWLLLALSVLTNVALIFKGNLQPVIEPERQLATYHSALRADEAAPGPEVIRQMQNLLTTLNGCSCDHSRPPGEPAFIRAGLKPRHAALDPSDGDPQVVSISRGHEERPSTPPRSRKMTMAVVFQIEAPEESPEGLEQEVGHLINAVHAAENRRTVELEPQEAMDRPAYRDCAHVATLGD